LPHELKIQEAATAKIAELDAHFAVRTEWQAAFQRDLQQALYWIGRRAEDADHRGWHVRTLPCYPCKIHYEVTDQEVLIQDLEFVPFPRKETVSAPAAGMPRKFSIGTLLAFTLGFAVLHSILKWFRVPTAGVLIVVGFFVAVAAGQALLFGGKQPRKASITVGALYGILWYLAEVWLYPFDFHPCLLIGSAIPGAGAGYLVGGLVAGLFLRRAKEPQEPPPGAQA
jgi:hypothetical protein